MASLNANANSVNMITHHTLVTMIPKSNFMLGEGLVTQAPRIGKDSNENNGTFLIISDDTSPQNAQM